MNLDVDDSAKLVFRQTRQKDELGPVVDVREVVAQGPQDPLDPQEEGLVGLCPSLGEGLEEPDLV